MSTLQTPSMRVLALPSFLRAEEFYQYVCERYQILINRLSGHPKPWTQDPILQAWKFTNVKRANDRTTKGLRKIYDAHRDAPPEQQLLNCAIYRYFGTVEFAEAVRWQTTLDAAHIKRVAGERMAQGLTVYTGAYMIHANPGDRRPKHIQIVDSFLSPLWYRFVREDLCRMAATGENWERFVGRLRRVKGFGGSGFMAKEVTLDTFMTSMWLQPPKDLNTWTPVGPGARRGVARVLGHHFTYAVSEDHCLRVIRELYALRGKYWPSKWRDLELHDIQFCLCEWDKYERVRLGEGKPRSRYAGLRDA